MEFESVIGLEIHAELKTRTKMFCASLNDPDETNPNVNICPVCMGHPGTLPVINHEGVAKVIQIGLALGGDIAEFSQFDRKNYFYPDLPKGYQISQYEHPIVHGGALAITKANGETKQIRIRRVHLEEDTGRSIHDPESKTTLVDFNRAGIPLLELVTEPDLRDAEEARLFADGFRRILQYLGASDANMEKGEMRIEANVSLRPVGSSKLGTKVELKNINSFRFVGAAIAAEIERQSGLLERGESVRQETRGWDERRGATVAQRSKESSHDYRYFPEPDLPPLRINRAWADELRRSLPELPAVKLLRFRNEFAIEPGLAAILVGERALAAFFEAAVSELREWLSSSGHDAHSPQALRLAANYLTTDVMKLLADSGTPIKNALLTPENFAELITYLIEGKISSRVAKDVLAESIRSGADPSVVIEEHGLWQVTESGALDAAIAAAVEANPKAVTDYRAGKRGALQFLLGQVMKEVRGANPETVCNLLEKRLR